MRLTQAQISDGSTALAAAGAGRRGWGRPGRGSWLALLLIGLFGLASTRNESVIAWLLDNDVFDESASRTLPAALTYAYVVAAGLALAAAWRVVAWPVLRVYAWAPVRLPIEYFARLVAALARALWRPVGVTIVGLGRVAAASLRMLTWGIAVPLKLACYGIDGAAGIGAAVVSAAGRLAAAGVGVLGSVLRGVRVGLSFVLGTVWLGVSAIVQAVLVVPVILLWALGSATFRYLGLGATAVLRPIGLGTRASFRYVGMALSTTVQAFALALDYLWRAAATILSYVGSTLAFVLRYAGLVIATPFILAWAVFAFALGQLRRVVATVLSYAGSTLAAVSRYARQAVIAPSVYASTRLAIGLRYVWQGVATVLSYAGSAVAGALPFARLAVWLVVSNLFIYAWKGLAIATGYLWLAVAAAASLITPPAAGAIAALAAVVATAARGVGYAGGFLAAASLIAVRLIALVLAGLMRPLWRAVAASANALGLVVAAVARGLGFAIRYAGFGILVVLSASGSALATLVRPLGWAIVTLASAIRLATLTLGWIAAGALALLARGVGVLLRLVGGGIAMLAWALWLVVSVPARTVWLGVATGWLLLGAVLGGGGRFAFSTVTTGVGAVPDAVRLVPRAVRPGKGGSVMSSSKLTRERWLSLIATLWVFGMVGFVGAAMVWPAPPEPTVKVVHWATGHLLRDWSDMRMLPSMAAEFNEAEHRTESGTLIEIEVYNSPSSEGAADLLCRVTGRRDCHQLFDGEKRYFPDPTIISPSSGHWLVTVNHEAGREVVDLESARSIARAFIGIVTYRDMAECLGWPEKELGYADILALRAHPDGWSSAGDCAKTDEWGERPLVAFTDPKTSSTGRSVLLALYAIAADEAPQALTIADVNDPKVVAYVKEFQGLIDHYSIGTTVLNTKIHQGPRYGHFFLMPEDNLIHLVDGTELAYRGGVRINAPPITEPMVMIYPKEGAMARNNCACIVEADWVTPEHREAADRWIDFLLEDAQQRSFMLAGFRPVTGLSLDDPSSRINAFYGLDPQVAAGLDVALIDPPVAAAIDASWEDVKRPGIVTFVIDTSGSMMGGKLRQAKEGLDRVLGTMATNNQVGFVSFADGIDVQVPVGPLRVNRYEIGGAVKDLRARGETALYDAIRVGIEMTEAAEGPADAIRAVVVLTDGQANAGRTHLDDLITMESNEVKIEQFSGFPGGLPPTDINGKTVSKSDVVGRELATESDVQIFFIGIGDDADLEVGRILAEATGAEFRGVAAEDLALLLADFGGYF